MNPYDVFPRRNLPPEAEEWGRDVERRTIAQESALLGMGSHISGQNRTSASTLESLALQIVELQNLYKAIPKPRQGTNTTSGFGLAAGWNTIASVSIANPGASQIDIMAAATGQLVSTTTSGNIELQSRLLLNGTTASPVMPGYWYNTSGDWISLAMPSYSWALNSTSGVTVAFQVNPAAAGSWATGTGSQAALSVYATFSG